MKTIAKLGAVLLMLPVLGVSAQTTEDAVFHPGPNTESLEVVVLKAPPMHAVGDVMNGNAGIETPSMDVPIKPAPPYMVPGEFTPEQVANLKTAQLKQMVKLGWLKSGETLKVLSSRRSAGEDLELYSLSIMAHQRAISEGRPGDYYIQGVKDKTISLDKLRRDVKVCGIKFEIYDGSGICSIWRDQQEAEQHYRASLDTIKEKEDANKMLFEVNNDIINHYEAAVHTIQQLKAEIKRLKRGRR